VAVELKLPTSVKVAGISESSRHQRQHPTPVTTSDIAALTSGNSRQLGGISRASQMARQCSYQTLPIVYYHPLYWNP
jgi:hypothetical protein